MINPQSNTGTVPHPQAAIVESQNAQRIARRRAAATLAASFAQTGRSDLRRGPKRQVGGTFETLQKVPTAKKKSKQGLDQSDIDRFLSSFRFDASRQVLAESRSGQVLPRNLLAPGTESDIIRRSRQRTSRVITPGFGNFTTFNSGGFLGGTLFSQL